MKKTDINAKYRSVAIYCAIHGGKNDGKAHILWSDLQKRFGISWNTYTHELHVNGMLYGGNGYEYLRPQWAAMTHAERMEHIKQMYPYPYTEQFTQRDCDRTDCRTCQYREKGQGCRYPQTPKNC